MSNGLPKVRAGSGRHSLQDAAADDLASAKHAGRRERRCVGHD